MASFRFIFPCGHRHAVENTMYVKGIRCGGQRPVELHITGDITHDYETIEEYYNWQKNVLHPYKGIMTHDGEIVYSHTD